MTHRYLVALINLSRLHSAWEMHGLGWDKPLPHHMVDMSSSSYFYNTFALLISQLLPPLFRVPARNTCWDSVYFSKHKVSYNYNTHILLSHHINR